MPFFCYHKTLPIDGDNILVTTLFGSLCGVLALAFTTLEDCLDAAYKQLGVDRLGDVVVGAKLEALNL